MRCCHWSLCAAKQAGKGVSVIQPQNLLIIMSDQHGQEFAGCYGHRRVQTPNLDRLARQGVRFANAYCNSPICVPSRASIATGNYIHRTGYWDNAQAYDGRVLSWGHRLLLAGRRVAAIGKLHYRSPADHNGFGEERDAMHIFEAQGDLIGLLRKPPRPRGANAQLAAEAGRGESSYTHYDRRVTAQACDWLRQVAQQSDEHPWVLLVSFVCPHFPLIAPDEWFDRYPPETLELPRLYHQRQGTDHPVLQGIRTSLNEDDYFSEEQVRVAVAAYLGLVSFMDDNVGQLLRALEANGLSRQTRVIYLSDHGESLGHRGIWGKSVMYDQAVAIPLIMAGADVPAGRVSETPVSLVDLYPTILEALGETPTPSEQQLPGRSLFALAQSPDAERTVFSEYHAEGAITGIFMLRNRRYKYVHYVDYPPQLFDLRDDPDELIDRAADPAYRELLETFEAALRAIVTPELASACAFDAQQRLIARYGGEQAILARGDFGHSPTPGETPRFY
jgi:choline-sulfatase